MNENGYQSEGSTQKPENQQTMDWDKVDQPQLPVPAGKYDLELTKMELMPDRKNGKPMVKAQFSILRAHDTDDTSSVARVLTDNFNFTQEQGFRVKNFADMTLTKLPTLINEATLQEWAASCLGAKVSAIVNIKELDKGPWANIYKYFEYKAPAIDVPTPEVAAASEGILENAERQGSHEEIDPTDLERLLRRVIHEELGFDDALLDEQWVGATFILRSKAGAEKAVPIEDLFHKVVALGNNLRLLDKKIELASLSDREKIQMRQYLSRCYVSLSMFNRLFAKPQRD